jgi:c-opsin
LCTQGLQKFEEDTSILISILIGIFWAIVPLFGWSEYSLEGAMISCSVEWNKRTASIMSYNISIALFVFILPLVIIIIINGKIVYIVRLNV